MATVEEVRKYLEKQDVQVGRMRAKVLRDLNTCEDRKERRRLVHLADRYGHFMDVLWCVRRFLQGEEIDLCQD